MAKDFAKALLTLAAQDDQVAELHRQCVSALRAIDEEIKHLQQQAALVRNLLTLYGEVSAAGATAAVIPPATAPAALTDSDDGLPSRKRGALIRQAALELARSGRSELSARDVLGALKAKGVAFSVKRPASMVGTVLNAMPEFRRLEQNRYAFLAQAGMEALSSQ